MKHHSLVLVQLLHNVAHHLPILDIDDLVPCTQWLEHLDTLDDIFFRDPPPGSNDLTVMLWRASGCIVYASRLGKPFHLLGLALY